jgi:hypothetical protein
LEKQKKGAKKANGKRKKEIFWRNKRKEGEKVSARRKKHGHLQ